MPKESVQSCDPDVANQLGLLAHNLGGDLRFGGNGQIGRACGDDGQDGPGGRQFLLLEYDRSGQFLISGAGELAGFRERIENLGCSPGCQDIISLGREALENPDYVFGRLAGAVDDLGEAPANLPMVIDAREAQILERQMTEFLDRLIDFDLVVLNLL